MSATVGDWRPCHTVTERQRSRAAVFAELPRSRSWTVICDQRLRYCRARAVGARERRYRLASGVPAGTIYAERTAIVR